MAKTKDKCLFIDDIEKIVDKRIKETSIEEWVYVLKQAIYSQINSYWYEEMEKSKHHAAGKGWVYTGASFVITNHPSLTCVNQQVQQVLERLKIEKGVKL